jgi:hypothetical protein
MPSERSSLIADIGVLVMLVICICLVALAFYHMGKYSDMPHQNNIIKLDSQTEIVIKRKE